LARDRCQYGQYMMTCWQALENRYNGDNLK
jgi:hypothetical protein